MYRNLRVRRELLKWRQEGGSYLSVIPLDIINLTVGYISPEIWKELFLVEKVWSIEVTPELGLEHRYLERMACFLSDYSVMVGCELNVPRIINLAGEVTICSEVVFPGWTVIKPDFSGGFWYLEETRTDNFLLHRYDRAREKLIETRSYPKAYYQNQLLNFIITETNVCYALYADNRGGQYTSLIIRHQEEEHNLTLYLKGEIFKMEYREGNIYLTKPNYRFEIAHPEQLTIDSAVEPTLQVDLDYRPNDHAGADISDVFYLTTHVIYLITSAGKIELTQLAKEETGSKIILLPSGVILFLTLNTNNFFTLYRLY